MGLFDRLRRPNKDRFAKKIIKLIRQAKPSLAVRYERESFRLLVSEGDGEPMISNLHNVFMEHCSIDRKQREKHLHQIVRATLSYVKEMPAEFEDAKYDILPCLRTGFYLEHIQLLNRIKGGPLEMTIPHQSIGDQLAAYLVYDLPESMRSISSENLESWGVTFYEAMELAMDNLRQKELSVACVDESLYMPLRSDPYNPSWILAADFIEELDVRGRPVATVPNANQFILTGSDDEEGLRALLSVTKKAFEEPRPLSSIAMVYEDREWQTWLPPREHPLFDAFQEMEIRSFYEEYTVQKQLLDTLYQQQKEEVAVAAYHTIQEKQSNRLINYSVWTEGTPALLPRSRNIFFARSEPGGQDIVAAAPWERVQEVVGHLMSPVGLTPPRFRVAEFPTDEELKRIGFNEP